MVRKAYRLHFFPWSREMRNPAASVSILLFNTASLKRMHQFCLRLSNQTALWWDYRKDWTWGELAFQIVVTHLRRFQCPIFDFSQQLTDKTRHRGHLKTKQKIYLFITATNTHYFWVKLNITGLFFLFLNSYLFSEIIQQLYSFGQIAFNQILESS